MSKNISTALVLDTSASMTYNNYVDITKINAKAFIDALQSRDKIAICNFDVEGHTPLSLRKNLLDKVKDQAKHIIDSLSFNGSWTNIGDGIVQAKKQLESELDDKGIVLLTDGFHNYGTNPMTVLPSGYPIFTCALGEQSDHILMQKIAAATKGQFYHTTKPIDLCRIYNQIRSLTPDAHGLVNNLSSINPDDYQLIPAIVSKGNDQAQFVIKWDNKKIQYTDENPSSTTLNISLVNPNDKTLDIKPSYIGEGYVIFNIDEPKEGQWYTQVLYGSGATLLPVSVGVYEFHPDMNNSIKLVIDTQNVINKKENLNINALLTHQGENIENYEIKFEIINPMSDSKKIYEKQLESISLSGFEVEGRYNIHMEVKGYSHINSSPFMRHEFFSVIVK